MKQFILFIFLTTLSLNAKMLISPIDVMKQNFGDDVEVTKKNILLNKSQIQTVQKDAKAKIKNKIFRIFKATKNNKTLGYGVLVKRKVRSKSAVILYVISIDSILKSIEIIAFNEPAEYIPSKTWMKQFDEIPTNKMLKVSRDIPTITGATMSASSIVNGSRVAFAIYKEILKGK